jgi:hypothetical protein
LVLLPRLNFLINLGTLFHELNGFFLHAFCKASFSFTPSFAQILRDLHGTEVDLLALDLQVALAHGSKPH